jgi:hypothetical protein
LKGTVDGIFDEIATAFTEPQVSIRATYDPVFGYPRLASIMYHRFGNDTTVVITLEDFELVQCSNCDTKGAK